MNKLNPIIEALDGIDENTALAAAQSKRRMKKPLKIAVIAAAATLLLGTTAAAATLGEHPIIKLNDKQVTPRFSSYVNENGWTIKTSAIEYPVDIAGYAPVGEIRAVYDDTTGDKRNDMHWYDELGVLLDRVSDQMRMGLEATKEGENDVVGMKGTAFSDHHQSEFMNADGTEISIECWQDPIQAAKQALAEKRWAGMSIDEKIETTLRYGWDYGYPEYGGFEHPTMRQLLEADAQGMSNVQKFKSLPSEAMKLYGYAPVSIDGFSERGGLLVTFDVNDHRTEHGSVRDDDPKIIQQMFVYTLTEEESGKDVKFTVWRSAAEKDVYTDHFGFDYEYIPLNNGTEARLHQSGFSNYIVEFTKDGAAYAAVLDLDRDLVERVLTGMELR